VGLDWVGFCENGRRKKQTLIEKRAPNPPAKEETVAGALSSGKIGKRPTPTIRGEKEGERFFWKGGVPGTPASVMRFTVARNQTLLLRERKNAYLKVPALN